jgi:hypothetical protein
MSETGINVSVLLPTRYRTHQLRFAIESILKTAAHPELIEFVLRVDDDDEATRVFCCETLTHPSSSLYISPQLKVLKGTRLGHNRHCEMYWECAQAASGKWLFAFNDDAWINDRMNSGSRGWDERLMKIPTTGYLSGPEVNVWNGVPMRGIWHAWHFFFMPNGWWKEFGLTSFGKEFTGLCDEGKAEYSKPEVCYPLDMFCLNYLCGHGFMGNGVGKGWKMMPVPGLCTEHVQSKDRLFLESGRKDHC